MDVYLNGSMIPIENATLSVEDAGFQHAVGLFETMFAKHGKIFRLPQHIQRLANSAKDLGLARELDLTRLENAVRQTVAHNKLTEARLRLTVTAGAISLLKPPEPGQTTTTTLVVATPPTQYDPAYFTDGVRVVVAPPGANPFDSTQGHKTTAYWGRLRTLRQAAAAGAGEAIWLNVTNHLASGAVSNIFLVKDNVLYTPYAQGEEVQGALPAPVLPGVTREAIIEIADQRGIEVKRQMLSVQDMLDADEVFLTNSSWLLLPVSSVERKTIGQGGAGTLSLQLRQALLDLVEAECSSDDQSE